MSEAQKKAVKKMVPSAYRSMLMSRLNMTKPNKTQEDNLRIWKAQKWLNLNALKDKKIEIPCGKKYLGQTEPTVCRPSKVVGKTPLPLAHQLSNRQIAHAIKIKIMKAGKRINWKEL